MDQPLKNHALLGSKYRLDGSTGQVINTEHQRIAQIINDYDHTLTLCWIPTGNRLPTDTKPWALVCSPVGGEEYVVMNLREDQIDERLIGAIFHARSGNGPLQRVEALERAQTIAKAKREEDEAEERKDLLRAVLTGGKDKLHTYRHNGKVYR